MKESDGGGLLASLFLKLIDSSEDVVHREVLRDDDADGLRGRKNGEEGEGRRRA